MIIVILNIMVEKLKKFLKVRSNLSKIESTPGLLSHEVSQVLSKIDESGGYTRRYFWRSLANLVDEKAQTG